VSRLDALRAELERLGAATFLVHHPVNVRYLTGFESSNAAVVVGPDRALLVTDGRYIEAARSVAGVEVVQSERELAPWLGGRLRDLAEPPVAFEANRLTYAGFEALAASGLDLTPAQDVVEDLRSVKEEEELAAIRRTTGVTNAVYERLGAQELVGSTEAEAAWRVEELVHEEGGDDLAFPVIVGSGPNAARPHHHSGERRIGAGETVIVDAGAALTGYCSDCTRTYVAGELDSELHAAYELCRAAQEEALAAVRSGASAHDVDAVARTRIREAGHEVLHGLGHGVGLEIHELPRLADTSEAILAAGNVVTIEPGVYLPGRGGVRIEDLVIVTDDGAEVLTSYTKAPVSVG
jgi:Xaa-Pro aminopeptidase